MKTNPQNMEKRAETTEAVLLNKARLKKALRRFFISLSAAVLGITLAFVISTGAEAPLLDGADPNVPISNDSETAVQQTNPGSEIAPDESSALFDLIGVDASQPLEVVLLITVLSVAPSLILMMTSFTRIIIIFSFLRSAMQTQTTPPNQVLTGLALFLTIFIMFPVFTEINEIAYQPYEAGEITTWEAVERAGQPLKTFMLKQTSNNNMAFFLNLANRTIYQPETAGTENEVPVDVASAEITLLNYQEQLGFEVVIPAFMISELSRAFQMGFFLFIPFLVIDIVVSSVLMAMGMMMLPPAMISLPFKIMIFVVMDGWQTLIGNIVSSFNL